MAPCCKDLYTIPGSWKHLSSCMASILTGHVTHWACLGCSGSAYTTACFQFLPISSNFAQPLKRSGPTFHRPQSTTWSTLCEGDVLHCMRQMVVTPDTDWFSDPPGPPQYSKTAHFRVAFYCASLRHTCAIIMLSNQHLDMPHLWGGWIISARADPPYTQNTHAA